MEKIKVLDLFSGIGGFSLAFDMEGFDIVTAIDRNKKSCEIYKKNFPNVNVICEEIQNIEINMLPDMDVLIGNLLIQYPMAAKTFEDINRYVYKIIEDKKPKMFVLETVAKNRLEGTITILAEMGYHVSYHLIDSEMVTGLPLIEKRIYLVGTRYDLPVEEIFLKESTRTISFREIMEQDAILWEKYFLEDANKRVKILDIDRGRVKCNFLSVPYIETPKGLRKITVREFARLKGYPDEYIIDDKTIWKMYQLVLRSTNVTVARQIAQGIKKQLAQGKLQNESSSLKLKPQKEKKDLTNSRIDRQNILNNELALEEIRKTSNIQGIIFENKLYFTKNMVATFFEVDTRTIERYVSTNEEELTENGYEVIKGKRLKEFKECLAHTEFLDYKKNSVNTKTTQLAIFDFKAFLNIAMLLGESENAKILRQTMLNIVIDFINKRTGGSTTYVNQRDKAFLNSYLQENDYRKEFTDALKNFVDMEQFKYAFFTDKIYQSIFKEKAREYREILQLKKKDRTRETFYSEILDLVASYECGLAKCIKDESILKGRKLSNWEVQEIFRKFEELPHWKPLIVSARTKMASRDLALRDAFHQQLEKYLKPLEKSEYEKFLGSEAQQLAKLMDENSDVLKRLKERE